MRGHIEIGGQMVAVEVGDLICLRCKHFDIKVYEEEIVEGKRSYSLSACNSSGTIWADGNPKACSRFEVKV